MSNKLTDRMIEEKLNKAITDQTPDRLDSLMTELGIKDEPVHTLRDSLVENSEDRFKKVEAKGLFKTGFGKSLSAVAALFILAFAVMSIIDIQKDAFAVVGLDINPSLEISVNDKDKVVSADALNADGEKILDGMQLKGSDIKVACNAVIGSMLANGYLTDETNSVLVSVRAKDKTKGKDLEKELAEDLNKYFGNIQISPAIIGEYIESDAELEKFADTYGLSMGKAYLIKKIVSENPKKKEEQLVGLTTQELVLLAQEKKVKTDSSYGNASKSKYIGTAKAKKIALKDAGVSESKARNIKVEFDSENGILVYEVEFDANGIEYDYDINAATGSIVKRSSESAFEGSQSGSSKSSGSKSSVSTRSKAKDDDDDDDDDDGDDDDKRKKTTKWSGQKR